MGRLLVIGLDGVTFDLLTPWVQEGRLPHLAQLLETGVYGVLKSTLPPVSPPAWTSFVTGKNPGKHGIFDFTARKPGSYGIEFVNGRWRRAPTLWKMMSGAGKRVCVLAVPMSYPPEQINGVMISGIDAPIGGVADPTAFHPQELHAEIFKAVGPYYISPNLLAFAHNQCDAMVEAALQTMTRKVETALYLLRQEPWDCFMLVLGETDAIAHRLWKYHDKNSPLHDDASARYAGEDPLLRIYQKMDQCVGQLCSMASEDTTIVVLSDHGQGGNSARAIYVNRWLEKQKLLRFKTDAHSGSWLSPLSRVAAKHVQWVKTMGLKCLPPAVKKKLFRKTQLANRMESWLRFAHIDWRYTQAYSEETPYFPTIWLNVRGREPAGIVPPEAYEEVRERIIQALSAWVDPETGQQVVKKVHKREEAYCGPCVEHFPDLIIEWHLDNGYSYLFKTSRSVPGRGAPIAHMAGKEREKSKSGDHRDYGIFIASGKHVQAQIELAGANIVDLAPTMLHLLDVPIPSDMDGKVLTQILQAGYLSSHPVRYTPAVDPEAAQANFPPTYSEEEEESIKARLKGLGYLE